MIRAALPRRGIDPAGSGEYRASRGARLHNGIDYCAPVGALIFAPVTGEITKIGFPYSGSSPYRYVEITSADGYQHRIFYVMPVLTLGNKVKANQNVIGIAQDICERYPDSGMLNHVHYEIKDSRGDFINPDSYNPAS